MQASSSAPAAVILAEAQKTLQASKSSGSTVPASRNLRPTRLTAVVSDHSHQNLRKSKRTVIDTASSFDPMKNVFPLPTRLPLLAAELQSIPSSISLDLFADLWPPAPSSFSNTPGKSWNIENQMRAAGYSVELVMRHCVKAALSWGL